jgi:hypothetical protein
MKKIFTLLAAIFLMATGWAQSPQKMSYQAVIRDASNHLITTQVGMKISILKGSSTGTAVFVETQTPTPNINGLITIVIGGGTPVTGTIAAIDWAAGPYFIKTETDPSGGTTYTITGTSELLSVPYALYTGHYVGELFGGGIIVAVWKIAGVEHGLIASLADLSTGTTYSDITTLIGSTAQSLTDGKANTVAILAQSANALIAARLCDNYTNTQTGTGVYSDWYLPAILELIKCFDAAFIVNTVLGTSNGFKFDFYWSSTEFDAGFAWYMAFQWGQHKGDAAKGNAGKVRAVRAF